MPWDTLRGDTIRVVIRELGFSEYGSLRKDEMIDYLRVVEHKGCMWNVTCPFDAFNTDPSAAGFETTEETESDTETSEPCEADTTTTGFPAQEDH